MSGVHERVDLDSLPSPICEFCGGVIDERGQPCPALDDRGVSAMSRGKQFPQFNAAARDWLEADVRSS